MDTISGKNESKGQLFEAKSQISPKEKGVKINEITESDVESLTTSQLRDSMIQAQEELRELTRLGLNFTDVEDWSDRLYKMSKPDPKLQICNCLIAELFVTDISAQLMDDEKARKLVKFYISFRAGIAFAVDCSQAQWFMRHLNDDIREPGDGRVKSND